MISDSLIAFTTGVGYRRRHSARCRAEGHLSPAASCRVAADESPYGVVKPPPPTTCSSARYGDYAPLMAMRGFFALA